MITPQPYFKQWFNLHRKGTLDMCISDCVNIYISCSSSINPLVPLLQARLPIEAIPLIQAGITTHYIRLPSVMICLMITSYCMGNKLNSD